MTGDIPAISAAATIELSLVSIGVFAQAKLHHVPFSNERQVYLGDVLWGLSTSSF